MDLPKRLDTIIVSWVSSIESTVTIAKVWHPMGFSCLWSGAQDNVELFSHGSLIAKICMGRSLLSFSFSHCLSCWFLCWFVPLAPTLVISLLLWRVEFSSAVLAVVKGARRTTSDLAYGVEARPEGLFPLVARHALVMGEHPVHLLLHLLLPGMLLHCMAWLALTSGEGLLASPACESVACIPLQTARLARRVVLLGNVMPISLLPLLISKF